MLGPQAWGKKAAAGVLWARPGLRALPGLAWPGSQQLSPRRISFSERETSVNNTSNSQIHVRSTKLVVKIRCIGLVCCQSSHTSTALRLLSDFPPCAAAGGALRLLLPAAGASVSITRSADSSDRSAPNTEAPPGPVTSTHRAFPVARDSRSILTLAVLSTVDMGGAHHSHQPQPKIRPANDDRESYVRGT